MQITVETNGHRGAITIEGRLDGPASQAVYDTIVDLVDGEQRQLELNLARCAYIDRDALSMLARAMERCGRAGVLFALAEPSKQVTLVLSLTKLDRLFPVAEESVTV